MEKLDKLTMTMIDFDAGDAKRIQHFVKVRSFCELIARGEGMDEKALYTLSAAAIVHDIGIIPALRLYGKNTGKLQEQLGPEYAEKMMNDIGFDASATQRACWLIAHHHTYDNINALDYQILVEADFIVNMYEDSLEMEITPQTLVAPYKNIFKTETGRKIYKTMFNI